MMSIPAISALLTCLMVITPMLEAFAEEPPTPPTAQKTHTRFFPGIPPKMRTPLWLNPSVVRAECPQPVSQEMEALDNFYIDELAPKILPAWEAFANEPGSRPIVKIVLSSIGELRDVSIVKPSNKPDQDNILVEGIRKRSPFPALPEGSLKERTFFFSYEFCRFRSRPKAEQDQLITQTNTAVLKPWVDLINQAARSGWQYSSITSGYKLTKVFALIDTETGAIITLKTEETSCDPNFDAAALKAIEAAAPFYVSDLPLKKLPPEFPKDIIRVQFVFEMSVTPLDQLLKDATHNYTH